MSYIEPPEKIRICVSEACNLRCRFCTCQKKGFSNRLIDFDVFKNIVDQVFAYSPKAYLSLIGKGETLMHPQAVDLIEYAMRKNVKAISVTTNGTLLSKEIQKEILERCSGLVGISVSVDGMKESYEKIRIGANYDQVVENVRSFIEMRNEMHKHNVQISMNMTKVRHSDEELKEYIQFWLGLGVDQLIIRSLFEIDHHTNITRWVEPNRLPAFPEKKPCQFLTSFLQFEYTGKIEHLCFGPYGEQKIVDFDLTKQSLKEIWESEHYQNIRKYHISNPEKYTPSCKDCEIWKIDFLPVDRKVVYIGDRKFLSMRNAYLNIYKALK
ncbi:radical SAM protein [candidate division KSB1 bacterium]|nr:radical SAM protein [candidate division KSB1 bacterium]